jgi:L-fuconolactonase
VKISGACTLSHEAFPYEDIWDPLGRIFDAFGFDRCLWGTDWTRAVGMLTYEQGVEAFRVTDHLSDTERAALMVRHWRECITGRRQKPDPAMPRTPSTGYSR